MIPGREAGAIRTSSLTHSHAWANPLLRYSSSHLSQTSLAIGYRNQPISASLIIDSIILLKDMLDDLRAALFRSKLRHASRESAEALKACIWTPSSSDLRGTGNGRAAIHVTGKSCTSGNFFNVFQRSTPHKMILPSTAPKANKPASPERDMAEIGHGLHSVRSAQIY